MFLDANSKQGDAAMTKYELEESFPGFMLFNSKGEFKGCAEGTLRSAKIMQ